MNRFFQIFLGLCIAIFLLPLTMPAFAESAPVYDAQAIDQQFNSNEEEGADFPPPPPPDQGGLFDQSSQEATSLAGSSMSMGERIRRIEQQINNMQNSDLSIRLNALQSEVQSLRGQMEQIMHEMQQLQAQQKNNYDDLNKRLTEREKQNLSTSATDQPIVHVKSHFSADNANDSSEEPGSSVYKKHKGRKGLIADDDTIEEGQPNLAEEQKIYQTAYNLIKAKNYNEAVNILHNMLQKYPAGQFASNAHYWLGELYGLMGKTDNALTEFNLVLKSYPKSPRVPDAQLKVGLIYAAESNWAHAKTAFRRVIRTYPGTSSARLASEQLKQIRKAGH